ncbi:MAG TPA: sigma-54 dependent transcriptional regulator [Thermoanaerobaculia bacterium]|nr:sigma-54 dependent transcriptional regulator [Thermoanaerobaculia bacterium]
MSMPQALAVDDDPNFLSALEEIAQKAGFETTTVTTLEAAKKRFSENIPDVVLMDLVLPDGSGFELLRDLDETAASTEVILITGHASVDSAVEALRLGVTDFLLKPIDVERLRSILVEIARSRESRTQIEEVEEEVRQFGRFGSLFGSSPAMQRVYRLISRVAPTTATVLVTGESGTGKELVAQTIHDLSRRAKSPYLPVNCGAISPTLIESELFGHERGSFTGAQKRHHGYFERAHGGTLFLDEISEMPLELQVKLLRVLETGQFMRIGGDRAIDVDVRILTATNRSPDDAVREGRLREDLLYRLQVFPIQLPPLRHRGRDMEHLAEHFLQVLNRAEGAHKRFSAEALEKLRDHAWPGNVRELKNVVHRAFILADDVVGPEEVPLEVRREEAGGGGPSVRISVGSSIADAEKQLIMATLEEYDGNKKDAADVLGISLKTLYNRLNAYKEEAERTGEARRA